MTRILSGLFTGLTTTPKVPSGTESSLFFQRTTFPIANTASDVDSIPFSTLFMLTGPSAASSRNDASGDFMKFRTLMRRSVGENGAFELGDDIEGERP
jgi:hypothetical protein